MDLSQKNNRLKKKLLTHMQMMKDLVIIIQFNVNKYMSGALSGAEDGDERPGPPVSQHSCLGTGANSWS